MSGGIQNMDLTNAALLSSVGLFLGILFAFGWGDSQTLSLITLPAKAEGLAVVDKTTAEKAASVPLTIQP
ncbi:hypothetical protein [Methylobacter sp.]|uniref:hypothetical protein n=1 Tax=Methylobacter sp. TaxID=2051955 RepID=UPI0011FC2C19|nr:hypothetical protein [Methylobacter sp.]TAK63901.1 MAG: hypothetical protein EPO18_05345 [Methylobacter sp.]